MYRGFLCCGMRAKIILLLFALVLAACGGGGGGSSPKGTLKVTINDFETGDPIQDARITVIDGATGDLIDILTTNADGQASLKIVEGQVLLKVAAQGYVSSPASEEGSPMPFAIVKKENTEPVFNLRPLAGDENLGWITGKALGPDNKGVANALVLASHTAGGVTSWYSTASDTDGSFVLFNVPAGVMAQVTALRAGYNFEKNSVHVHDGSEIDIHSTLATASLTGKVKFLATSGETVEVTMLHPGTGAAIPGLRVLTEGSGFTYNLTGIPDGTFNAIASLETDGYVLDPDSIEKHGLPQITVSNGVVTPATLDFDVTGAVNLELPVNFQDMPLDGITFKWTAYPSAKNYILELIDDSGKIIWGGNEPVAGTNYTLGTATQLNFNPDWASEPLVPGNLYRVRVFASVNTPSAPFYKLISVSEDLVGVFRITPAP